MNYAGNVIQEELMSTISLFMVNNTATNKSCISHQQVVINSSYVTVIHSL